MARKGIPDPRDYLLGRGELFFGDDLDADGRAKNMRTLGHAEAFTVTVEAETLEHFSKLNGLSVKDREVVLQQNINFTAELSEIDVDNLALLMSGTSSDTAVIGASVAPVAGNDNVIVSATNGLGKWYLLYDVAAPSTYPPVAADNANRVYRISLVSVKNSAGTVTYIEGTDYTVDYELGRIRIEEDGSITNGSSLLVAFTYASLTLSEIRALSLARIAGQMMFISRNANQTGNGSQMEYMFHSVTLSAEGDFALVGEEFATLSLSGSAETNEKASPNSPTLTIRRLSV